MFKRIIKFLFWAATTVWFLAFIVIGLATGIENGFTIFALPFITGIAILFAIWPILLIGFAFWGTAKLVGAIRKADSEA